MERSNKRNSLVMSFLFLLCIAASCFAQDEPQILTGTPNDPLLRAQFMFDGQWMPDFDESKIGAINYKTLQNFRYTDAGLTVPLGYTKINSTNHTYGVKPISMIQLESPYTTTSYVLLDGHDSSTLSNVLVNKTAVPGTGDFEGTALDSNTANSLFGRFSKAPNGNIAYANGESSKIWGGEEMQISAYYTVDTTTATYADLTYAAAGDTITTAGGNYTTDGFLPGQVIAVTTSTSNNRDFTIKSIGGAGTVITVVENAVVNEGAANADGVFTVDNPRKDPVDWTREVTNNLSSAGNVAPIGGGIDASTNVMLHFDGDEGSTTITNSSTSAAPAATANGDAKLITTSKVFGTASGTFDGTGDYIGITDDDGVSDYFFMGTDEVTVDFRLKVLATPGAAFGLFGQRDDADNRVRFYLNTDNTLNFESEDATVVQWAMSRSWTFNLNQWYHIAVIRGWDGDEDKIVIAVDGAVLGVVESVTATDTWPDLAADLQVATTGGGQLPANVEIDEFRVSKGIARWTENEVPDNGLIEFAPPTSPYLPARLQWYVFTTRPLKAVKYYVQTANVTSSSTTVETWDGSGMSTLAVSSDGTKPGAISMAQTGTIAFQSSVNVAKPFHFERIFLYVYKFTLSAGSAGIYQVTADAPFQDVVDIWDGINRQPIAFNMWDDSAETWRDYTLEVNIDSDTADNAYGGEIGDMTTSDYIVVMFDERQAGLTWFMLAAKVNTAASVPTVSYWDGTQYVTTGNVTDKTIADPLVWQTLGGSGVWTWRAPEFSEEKQQSLFGQTGYTYKLSFDGAFGGGVDAVKVDRLYGMPAQRPIDAFDFPALFNDRLFLFSNSTAGEGNRADFSQKHAPDTWNGDDSDFIHFGGRERITAAIQLQNRYGSNIFTILLVLKPTEAYILVGDGPPKTTDNHFRVLPVSSNIGCPAPNTLVTAEVGFEVSEGTRRNVAMWLSYAGPMGFDGSVPFPIKGVENFFDANNTEAINYAAIEASHAYFDPVFKEYNLFIPSGSGQVTINKWLVYDVARNRWWERVPTLYPQGSVSVVDTDGARYAYGLTSTGFMMRLDNGTDDSGTAIASVVETGDFFPTNSIWDKTLLRRFKVAATDIAEAGKNLAITHYADTATSGTSLTALDLDSGSNRIVRLTQATNLTAWSHRVKFAVSTSSTGPNLELSFWGYTYRIVRDDL